MSLARAFAPCRRDPFVGLTSWAAFLAGKKADTMVMGDLVLFEDEVNPVMSAALDNGLEVTALHNHFFFDNPKVISCTLAVKARSKNSRVALRQRWPKWRKAALQRGQIHQTGTHPNA